MKNLMRNLFSLGLVAVLLLGSSASASGALNDPAPATGGSVGLVELGTLPPPVELRFDPNAKPVHVPEPPGFFQPHPQTSTFAIDTVQAGNKNAFGTTCQAFPANALTAFTYAANVWASLITSPVPIRIEACWANLTPGILGQTGALNYFSDNSSSLWYPQANRYYQVALVNALNGTDVDPTRDDMSITYSNYYASSFYYGTDGNTPGGLIDFVSVVMHEIAHGLGFSGSMTICTNGNGEWGFLGCPPVYSGYPVSYDSFAVDGAGHALIDPAYYANYSTGLASALQSKNVFFTGENAKFANNGANVKLYAPTSWQPGSSFSHLDDGTFAGTSNAMMVHAIGYGYAVHDPGPVGLGVLKDVGWAPFAPSGLTATAQANHKINLSWTSNSRNQVGFKVERSPDGSTGWAQIGTTAAITYTDNNPPPAGSYAYYRVRAYHALGDSLPSNVTTSPMAAPGSLTATASSPTQVDLAWSDLDNRETNYQVYRSPGGASTYQPLVELPANSIAYSDISANPGLAYDYEVRATNSGGTPAPSPWSYASAVTPLNAPQGLVAGDAVYPGQVTLTWQDTNNNETGYQVEGSLTGAAPWTVVCTTLADATSCGPTGLTELTLYYFQVRAINSVAQSAVVSTSAVTTLLAPTGLMASTLTTSQVNLYWTNHSTLATGTELQRSLDGLTGWVTLPEAGLPPTATSYTDTDITAGTFTYYYRVRATGGTPASNSPFTPTVRAVVGPNWIYMTVIYK